MTDADISGMLMLANGFPYRKPTVRGVNWEGTNFCGDKSAKLVLDPYGPKVMMMAGERCQLQLRTRADVVTYVRQMRAHILRNSGEICELKATSHRTASEGDILPTLYTGGFVGAPVRKMSVEIMYTDVVGFLTHDEVRELFL